VVVQGVAREVTDPGELARLRSLPLGRSVGERGDRFVSLSAATITGCRIEPSPAPPAPERQPRRPDAPRRN